MRGKKWTVLVLLSAMFLWSMAGCRTSESRIGYSGNRSGGRKPGNRRRRGREALRRGNADLTEFFIRNSRRSIDCHL